MCLKHHVHIDFMEGKQNLNLTTFMTEKYISFQEGYDFLFKISSVIHTFSKMFYTFIIRFQQTIIYKLLFLLIYYYILRQHYFHEII